MKEITPRLKDKEYILFCSPSRGAKLELKNISKYKAIFVFPVLDWN